MSSFRQNAEAKQILAQDAEFLLPVYPRYPVVMERGEGVFLFDAAGNRYLDLMAGLGVNALGHAHPRMVAAAADQAAKIIHLSPQYANRYPGELAERLCGLAGMSGVFYSTGGSEAVEGALKLARTYARQNFGGKKIGFVALHGSYHGRTYGSLSVTGQEKYSADFEPGLPGVSFVDRNDIAALRTAVSSDTCAILIEPLMGEGGVHECTKEFLEEARRLADQHKALLVFDEIQSGLGRTGDWFAFEHTGVRPDVLILGKPLGGGIPLSALLVGQDLFHTFGMSKHGSTLGGSPFACRLGVEFLSVVEEDGLLAHVRETGEHLAKGLAALVKDCPAAMEARGYGLLQGVEINIPGRPVAEAALQRGFMLNVVQGNVIRFLPPFLLTKAHVDSTMELLHELLGASAEKSAAKSLVGTSA